MADDTLRDDLANNTDPTKGAALVGYNGPSTYAFPRKASDKFYETRSILDYGAIGDGSGLTVEAWYTAGSGHKRLGMSSLADVQAAYPEITTITAATTIDALALQLALKDVLDREGGVISLSDSRYKYHLGNGFQFHDPLTNLVLEGHGACITSFRTSRGNTIRLSNISRCTFRDILFSGNVSTGAAYGNYFSIVNPNNSIWDNLQFRDIGGTGILIFTNGSNKRNQLGICTNNCVIDYFGDGGGLPFAGLITESSANTDIIRPQLFNHGAPFVDPENPEKHIGTGFGINPKNNCLNLRVLDFLAVDCYTAVTLSDDGDDENGAGCKNWIVTGTALRCKTALSVNKTASGVSDVIATDCGGLSITDEARPVISVAGFNLRGVHTLSAYGVQGTSPLFYSRSNTQSFILRDHDSLVQTLLRTESSARYNSLHIENIPVNTGTWNPYNLLDVSSNYYPSVTWAASTQDMDSTTGVQTEAYLDIMLPGVSRRSMGLRAGATSGIYVNHGGARRFGYDTTRNAFVPGFSNNAEALGWTDRQWSTAYLGSAPIVSSDARAKGCIENIPDEWLDAWGDVRYVRYKMRDAIDVKGGPKARWHVGAIAQEIRDVFANRGLDPFAIGLLCWDKWEATPADLDGDNNIVKPEMPGGDRYGIRYEELLSFEAAYMRRALLRIEAKLAAK